MNTNRIEMLSGGRFVSHHEQALVYYDSRHRVIQTQLEGGRRGELVEELQPEGIFTAPDWPKRSYRAQLFTVRGDDGVRVIALGASSQHGNGTRVVERNPRSQASRLDEHLASASLGDAGR